MKKILINAFLMAFFTIGMAYSATISGFGIIPGASSDPYGGSGIPPNTSIYTQVDGLPGGDTLTLGQSTTQYKSSPVPGNDGVMTYYVETGPMLTGPISPLALGRSKWNWNFYKRSANDVAYDFALTIKNMLNGLSYTFDPTDIPDNAGSAGEEGNSESFDFLVFGGPIFYDQNLDNTYVFDFEAFLGSTRIAGQRMIVVAGLGAPTASVPDSGSTAGLLALGVFSLGFIRRKVS